MLDAESNSATNGPSFKGIVLGRYGDSGQNTVFCPVLLVYLAKIFCSTYAHCVITFFGSRIQFCIECSEFQRAHLGKILWVWMKILCFDPVLLVCLGEICFFDLCSPSNSFCSMQNLILNPPKPIREPSQVEEQISPRRTSKIGPKTQYFGPNSHIFPRQSL